MSTAIIENKGRRWSEDDPISTLTGLTVVFYTDR